jgi:hypothetical protein
MARPNYPVVRRTLLDKDYHSHDVLVILKEVEVRSYCSEPDRGRRNWTGKEEEKAAVYQDRRRIRGERGKRPLIHAGIQPGAVDAKDIGLRMWPYAQLHAIVSEQGSQAFGGEVRRHRVWPAATRDPPGRIARRDPGDAEFG